MWQPQHAVHRTLTPAPFTLGVMGKAAREAARTWTLREWAARLATRAKPRDYVGQLRELYRGILERWRYVQEPDEWVHGSARSLLGHVLGLKYNTPDGTDYTRVDPSKVSAKHKGWGDCDDVATLAAAGVQALGMTPYFRVVANPRGGAHVSVVARTPRGEMISLDPVGHPEHGFGWAAPGRFDLFDMYARPATTLLFGSGEPMQAFGSYDASTVPDHTRTFFGAFDESMSVVPRRATNHPHWCAVRMGDVDGPRVLAIPLRYQKLFMRGFAVDGVPAVDEFGNVYRYDADRDLWIDNSLARSNLAALPEYMGGLGGTFERMGAYGRRRGRRRGRARKFFRRVGRGIRKVAKRVIAPILKSRVAQNLVGGALQIVGIPRRLTKAIMAAAGELIKRKGIIGLIRLIRKNPKAALRLVAQAGRAGLRAGARMFGPDEMPPMQYALQQGGATFPAQPVAMLMGVPGVWAMGDLDVASTPTPGQWYRVKSGDTLLGVAGRAYGLKAGGERLRRARWINRANANAPYIDTSLADSMFPEGRISFRPRWACDPAAAIQGQSGSCFPLVWIPMAEGDEPPETVTMEPEQVTPLPDVDEPEPEPEPEPTVAEPQPPLPPVAPEPEPEVAPEPPAPPPPEAAAPLPPAPPVEPEPAPEVAPEPEPPVGPAKWELVKAACERTGGQWVIPPYAPPGSGPEAGGCVTCPEGQRWSDSAGRCIPVLTPTAPPVQPPPIEEPPDVPDIEPTAPAPAPVPMPPPEPDVAEPPDVPEPPPMMPPVAPTGAPSAASALPLIVLLAAASGGGGRIL